MLVFVESFVINSMAGIIMTLLYVLLFAQNVAWNRRKIRVLLPIFWGLQLVGSIMQNRVLIFLTPFLLLLIINLYYSTRKLYNFIMMVPTFFFYCMMTIIPPLLLSLIFSASWFIDYNNLGSILTDVVWCIVLIYSAILCERKRISLTLTKKEIAVFCIYFSFLLFNVWVVMRLKEFLEEPFLIGGGILILIFSLFVFAMYWSYLFTKRENQKLVMTERETRNFLDMQLQFAEINQDNQQELRQLRHDMRGHMQMLGELCSRQEYDKVDQYVEALSGSPGLSSRVHITGNATADIVLSVKRAEAKKRGVEFECEGDFSALEQMNAVDICTIFTNLMNNALEASEEVASRGIKATESEARILIKGIRHKNYFTLLVSNTVSKPVMIKNNRIKTTKEDKQNHGIGLDSVKAVVKKYQGDCVLEYRDGWFINKIILLCDI